MALREIELNGLCASSEFTLMQQTATGQIGQIPHNYGSPYWTCKFDLLPMSMTEGRNFEADLDESEGVHIFSLFDTGRPYPAQFHDALSAMGDESMVQGGTVLAMGRASRSWTINLARGQTITRGDALAFVDKTRGRRHYARAQQTVNGQGGAVRVEVNLRPRYSISGLSEPCERIRPRCRFMVDLNKVQRRVEANYLYRINGITGTEYLYSL